MLDHRRHRREGAASIEAVIMLPVLALLLAGVIFLGRAYGQAAAARSVSRRCAWQLAAAGCPGGADLPAGCQDARLRVSVLDDEETSGEASQALRARLHSEPSGAGLTDRLSVLDAAIGSLIGTVATAHVTREVPWSPIMSARSIRLERKPRGSMPVGARSAALCNPRPLDPLGDVEQALRDLVSGALN